MNRLTAVLVLALVLAGACQDTTGRARPTVAGPSFQEGQSDYECRDETLIGRSFHNVIVPKEASCTIDASELTGNLVALEGSLLETQANTIAGNIQADKAFFLHLENDRVNGNIDIVGTAAGAHVSGATVLKGNLHVIKTQSFNGFNVVQSNTLNEGSIKVEDNNGTLSVTLNSTPKNIQVYRNTGPTAIPSKVTGNTAGHSIHCVGNHEPFVGGPNPGTPKAKGQCFTTTPTPLPPPGPDQPPPGEQ